MKKLAFTLILALLTCTISAVPAALAEGLAITDITDYFPDDIQLLDVDEGGQMRMYYCDDSETAMEDIMFYAYYLFELYDFDDLAYDVEASDTFIYMYIKTYKGDADISPEYMDDCPEPCYVLFALTGYEDGVLIVASIAEGITFADSGSGIAGGITDAVSDEPDYIPPVAGSDGLLVIPMEEYFTGIERSYMFVEDDCYGYRYTNQGRYYDGEGSDEYREMYVQYVNDLVATGYYTLLEHYEDKMNETWRLGYTGDADLETFRILKSQDDDAVIVVDLLFENGYVYYSYDIATTNLEEAAIESGLLDEDRSDNSSSWDDEEEKMECPRCWGSGESQCTTCWGSGQVNSSATSSGRETCDDCRGRGRDTCGYCNGRGTIN